MRRLIPVLLLLSLVVLLFGCSKQNIPNTGLPNPASQYCEKQGYTLTIVTGQDGNQYGICKFNDGTECEEWDYFNGKCKPGDTEIAVPVNEEQCKSMGGKWDRFGMIGDWACNLPTKDGGKLCTDGSQCEGNLCLSENEGATTGKCTGWKLNFGCFTTVSEGKPSGICID